MVSAALLTDAQLQSLARILMQYAPAGWLRLSLTFKVTNELVRLDSWAETQTLLHHGFRLDDVDADTVEALLLSVRKVSAKSWSALLFHVGNDGQYFLQID